MDTEPANFSAEALQTLKSEVIHGFKLIPRRGAEVGGLLVGEITRGEITNGAQVRVTGVVPVPVEYRFGPTWRFSDLDKRSFAAAIAKNGAGNVIGWYRSHTRSEAAPLTEDRALTEEFFPDRQSAFLICYPDIDCNVAAKLCIWSAGRGERVSELQLGRFSLLDEALQAAVEGSEEDRPPERPSSPMPAIVLRPSRWPVVGRAVLIAAMSVAMILIAGFLLRNRSGVTGASGSVQARSIHLGLKVDRQGPALLVAWNRDAPEILKATDATFKIAEGAQPRFLRLTPRELHTGGLVYTPLGGDVEMDLEVHNPAGNFTESIRVVGLAQTAQVDPRSPGDSSALFIPPAVKFSVPPNVRRADSDVPQVVQVDVTIDPRGSVTKAVVGKAADDISGVVTDSAVAAARQWRFAPATLGGRPIESRMRLKFVFPVNPR